MATLHDLSKDGHQNASEWCFLKGFSDGFPVVPPTQHKVDQMLSATARDKSEFLGECPPIYGRVTVEKVAINAVLAGCLPEHMTLVLAGVECMLDPDFNIHGVNATTMGATPALIVNGPIRHQANLNSQHGALGSGTRSNACIGRAIKLVLQNCGAAKLGGTESTTLGTPMKFGLCISEWEEKAPEWEPYHTLHGAQAHDSVVSMVPVVSGPHQIVDFLTSDAEELCVLFAKSMVTAYQSYMPMINDVTVVVSPEHYQTFVRGGITSKKVLQMKLWNYCNQEFAPNVGKTVQMLKKGIKGAVLGTAVGAISRMMAAMGMYGISKVPKFLSKDRIHIVVAGASAGKFSAFMPGFGIGEPPMPSANLSQKVSRKVEQTAATAVTVSTSTPDPAPLHILDPTSEKVVVEFQPAARSGDVFGTVGLMDISKGGGAVILDYMATYLKARFPGIEIVKFQKPTFSRPAPLELVTQITRQCNFVVAALAD